MRSLSRAIPRVVIATALVVTLAVADRPASAAPSEAPVVTDGDFASVGWWNSPTDNGFIWVNRGDARSGSNAFGTFINLSYNVQQGSSWESGSCKLADGDVAATARTLTLDVDTSVLPVWTSGPQPAAFCWYRQGAGGEIAISWQKTHQYRSSWSGRQEFTFSGPFGTVTFRITGTRHSSSAAVSGTALGTTLMSPTGDLGRSHQLQMEVAN